MMYFLRAFRAMLGMALAAMIQYRGEGMLWALWGVIYPAVSLAMWEAALAGSNSQSLNGFDARDFAAYFLMSMVVAHVTAAWDLYEMGWLVRSGSFSPQLLKPILSVWNSVVGNLSYKIVICAILIPIWAGFAWYTQPRLAAGGLQIGLGLLALGLGAVINYILGYSLALIAFWTTRIDAVGEFWFGGSLIFGGRLAPLGLLPGVLQWLAWLMPFKWIVWFPCEALMGRISTVDICAGLAVQSAWVAIGVVFFRIMWRAGRKQYAAVGA